MKRIVALFLLLLAGAATAQPVIDHYYELVVGDMAEHTFEMGAGACLRGPMTIYTRSGSAAFILDDGVYFPTGCAK